ncbi:class I SAM-dependent methyltransferase [Picrophilus oshimae]|uniref:Methyltransferase n=1 Tax=Picrophilus torridus (strain ATCC 700027 / DSM 9790 / JCM 10055 / NBRC 100828 / KAW 2/3) TaxID=1122961 RepID=A0A8G2FWU9_PICTO|nr:class I SAM-dependent methyltransferase family protein [Picrophilus oshimae]SMD30964.1 methyltransferase [Picrophilus oshimae DSM 9789]
MIHAKVIKKNANSAINHLKDMNIIDKNYRVFSDDCYVYIPLKMRIDSYDCVDLNGLPARKHDDFSASYDVIGSIAIIKRKDIDDAIKIADKLIKRKNIDAVYLDDGISGNFRQHRLRFLAGNELYETIYRENNIKLKVNIKYDYFSPRLATERLRVSNMVSENEFIIDMFAGVGPFSILIASRHNVNIIAIDINCHAISMLNENIKMNKLTGRITGICGDSSRIIENYNNADRIIMNLPHDSFNFIDIAYRHLRKGGTINYYEILDYESLYNRMEFFKNYFEISSKRIVHGYSKSMNMYAIDLKKL